MVKKVAVDIISALLILLFVYAAISKLIDHKHFVHFLGKINLFAPVAAGISWLVPFAELTTSALLSSRRTRMVGLISSLSLLLLFTGYLSFTLALDKNIPCSCGGILQGLKWGPHIAFNTLFIIISFIAIMLELKKPYQKYQQTFEVTH